jgi:hypothetical protein
MKERGDEPDELLQLQHAGTKKDHLPPEAYTRSDDQQYKPPKHFTGHITGLKKVLLQHFRSSKAYRTHEQLLHAIDSELLHSGNNRVQESKRVVVTFHRQQQEGFQLID